MSANKIIFANQLRGVAALLVVLSHICGAFWMVRDVVGYFSGTPEVTGETPLIAQLSSNHYLNFGALGVAVFFMISGFVIPMSIGKSGRMAFIVARFFRIYPTYIVCLGISMLAVLASTAYWGKSFMWDFPTMLSNAFLVNSMIGIPSIDLVNWTLAIELKFYIVVCLMSGFIISGRVLPLLAFALLVYGANSYFKTALGTELLFVSFMMLGVLFNYLYRGLISIKVLSACSAFIIVLFALGWDASYWPGGRLVVGPNYLYGFAIFALAYACRDKFVDIRVLDFFADISYPLYVVHSLLSYGIMRVMIEEGFPVAVAMSLAMVCAVSIAYAVHRLVEKPTMHLGKKLRVRPAAVAA